MVPSFESSVKSGVVPEDYTFNYFSDSDSTDSKTEVSRHKLNRGYSKDSSTLIKDDLAPLLNHREIRSRVRLPIPFETGSSLEYGTSNRTFKNSINHNKSGLRGNVFASSFPQKTPIKHSKSFMSHNERAWYDQFTSTDWVHDSITDSHRVQRLRCRKDFRGRLKIFFDGCEGWILSALVGFLTAIIAYIIDVAEAPIFDWKEGYCSNRIFVSHKQCCPQANSCHDWKPWSTLIQISYVSNTTTEFVVFVGLVTLFSTLACLLTLTSKTTISSSYQMSSLDENLAIPTRTQLSDESESSNRVSSDPISYFPAAGSGVAEVRVLLSGFVLHGFLGVRTLLIKSLALILSISSGLSVGKEGPFVHIATCIGNIACRLFSKYHRNDGKLREILSAAAAAGVAVAFGAPIGGVLFSLEEVAYFFPAKTLFRTFFCSITAALTLKFLNPFGTKKIVLFEVRYLSDWQFFELIPFIIVGFLGGGIGAMFIKASRAWAHTFRPIVKNWPLLEVFLVALLTGVVSFWNPFAKLSVAKLLYNLASPCYPGQNHELGICPEEAGAIKSTIHSLIAAFIMKGLLTIITFGIKVPAGIYVPSMVVGGLGGRIIGHMMQIFVLGFPTSPLLGQCARDKSGLSCITPGVYALVAAGSTMCGVTRLSVTLAVILFEITGSLDYVLPCSLSILVAKWTADAIEPQSIYDLLTELNSYPLLDNKHKPIFTSELASIVPPLQNEKMVDISEYQHIPVRILQRKLRILQETGEFDGALAIIQNHTLVGLLPAPELQFALDNIKDKTEVFCLLRKDSLNSEVENNTSLNIIDLTPFIDTVPLTLDVKSPLDLVYQCFVKLGLRYICITLEGRYIGTIHKKTFVRYTWEVSKNEGHV